MERIQYIGWDGYDRLCHKVRIPNHTVCGLHLHSRNHRRTDHLCNCISCGQETEDDRWCCEDGGYYSPPSVPEEYIRKPLTAKELEEHRRWLIYQEVIDEQIARQKLRDAFESSFPENRFPEKFDWKPGPWRSDKPKPEFEIRRTSNLKLTEHRFNDMETTH